MSLEDDQRIASPIHLPRMKVSSVARTVSKSVKKSITVNPVVCVFVILLEFHAPSNSLYSVIKVFAKTWRVTSTMSLWKVGMSSKLGFKVVALRR